MGYYWKFIKNFGHTAKPLTTLMQQWWKIHLGTNPSNSICHPKRSTYTSTHTPLPRPLKALHSIHRCFGWCLWCLTVPGTWWPGIACCLPLTHIHRNSMQMEHPWTRTFMWNTMSYPSRIITSKVQISLCTMTTSPWRSSIMGKMLITK